MRTAWLVLLASITLDAHADPLELPTIESEHPPTLGVSIDDWATDIERVDVAIHTAPERSWVTVSLAGREGRGIDVWLDVPAGTRVHGLGLSAERGSVWGRPMHAGAAAKRHRSSAVSGLLAWSGTSAAQDHYRITVETPVTLDIALQLPPLVRLAVEASAGVVSARVDGDRRFVTKRARRREVIELGDVAGVTGPCARCASEHVSIVAAKASVTEFLEPLATAHHRGVFVTRDIDKTIIRRYMKRHMAQLRHCYMRVAQWNPAVQGGVILSFSITAAGTIGWAKTQESDLPASVNACLVENVLRWEFPATDGTVQVNYPLEFRIAD